MSRFDSATLARALAYVGRPVPPEYQPTVISAAVTAANDAAPDTYGQAIEVCAVLCRRFEGFRADPYLCPAGVPSIGYGATHYADGRPVKLTDPPISSAQAERLLLLMIRRTYLPALLRQCPAIVHQAPGRVGALADYTYNLGEGNLSASSLRRKVNAGDWASVPTELRKWVYAAGRVLHGLVLRREAEVQQC